MSKRVTRRAKQPAEPKIKVVDLFCGVGGLSHGLKLEGFDVVAGVDNDKSCKFAFERNNRAKFIGKDIARFSSSELNKLFGDASIRVLVGCAPCQPYSSLTRKKLSKEKTRERWYPLYRFMRLVSAVQPEIVSMENVPDLSNKKKYEVFDTFVKRLTQLGYRVSFKTVDASRYGVPQRRNRLVLLASKLGEIDLIAETHSEETVVTVRDTIGELPRLRDGGMDRMDPLHRASKLSPLNKMRIAATPKNGGSATSWKTSLIPSCYRKESGKSYMVTVYGRMRWNDPAPTMTTHCTTLGTGRFGHPTQNRAISLREAARFQTFPDSYVFHDEQDLNITRTAKHIGNAVPVLLARAIGKSIKKHIRQAAT
ncbi:MULTISPECIES: DNA (cytosine-5-)-methyltransferase [unclassified Bradyrhizobium]|uniref:DNA cytosine methyltransferase n=1 Tax=unclassified Bradyrhizobium TaxID=2631580 RepID=UPI0028EE24AB|nr:MULTISPECIES: DNA (cytosine-5-)-methyltransferase [unclassified Bradyrhizobium]